MPQRKIVVNLAPSSLRKTGTAFDLPIALGILAASNQLDPRTFCYSLVIGELSLEGGLRAVTGSLAYEVAARDRFGTLICPQTDDGLAVLDGLTVYTPKSLNDFRCGELPIGRYHPANVPTTDLDFSQVGGHDMAKRALQIAATGNHGVLMVGPPGSGKTMLASRMPTILSPLEQDEFLETAQVYSVAGEDISLLQARQRPFRSPHHTITAAGLLGGGNPIRPGEASLAHNGVLFLDELAEFSPSVLQGLRQPMETGKLVIARASGNIVYPAHFLLLAATNPCPCGYFGDPEIPCRCSVGQIDSYQNRIGGPLMDRIDIQIDVLRADFDQVVHKTTGTSSATLKNGVDVGRRYAAERRRRFPHREEQEDLAKAFDLTGRAEAEMKRAADMFDMSGRSIVRALRLARTIADMAEQGRVEEEHVMEALMFRIRERVR